MVKDALRLGAKVLVSTYNEPLITAEWAVAIFKEAKASGLKRMLIGVEMVDRGIARDGYKVLDESGTEIGYVTSGSPAPFLKKNIALAYVPPEFAYIGSSINIEIRGQAVKAQVVPTPCYKKPKKKFLKFTKITSLNVDVETTTHVTK